MADIVVVSKTPILHRVITPGQAEAKQEIQGKNRLSLLSL